MDLPFFSKPTASEPERTIALRPGKIVAVGKNYRDHAAELGGDVPPEPLLFFKATSGLIGDGDPFPRPGGFERVDYEGEIGVVIGKAGRRIPATDALSHVLGFVCVNDFTIRDLQRRDSQWARAKGFDGSCAIGPRIVAGLALAELSVRTRVDGQVRQSATAADMAFDIPTIIEFVSEYMTLEEGDVIATGTPAGVGNLEVGQTVTVEVSGVGVLSKPVVEDPG